MEMPVKPQSRRMEDAPAPLKKARRSGSRDPVLPLEPHSAVGQGQKGSRLSEIELQPPASVTPATSLHETKAPFAYATIDAFPDERTMAEMAVPDVHTQSTDDFRSLVEHILQQPVSITAAGSGRDEMSRWALYDPTYQAASPFASVSDAPTPALSYDNSGPSPASSALTPASVSEYDDNRPDADPLKQYLATYDPTDWSFLNR